MKYLRWLPLALSLVMPTAAVAQRSGIQVEVELLPDPVGVEEVATLEIRVQAGGIGRLRIRPDFALDNLEIIAGPSRRESFRFADGATVRTESLLWQLRPREVGPARVRSLSIKVRNEELRLPTRTIQVVAEAPRRRPGARRLTDPFGDFPDPFRKEVPKRDGEPEVFLRATVEPKRPYIGEQVTYTLYIYTQADISAINPEQLPDFHGFWVREIPQPQRLTPEMYEIDGERFGRVVLIRRALFPMRSGRLELEPARAHISMKVPEQGAFGSLLSQTRDVRRTSNPITLSVRELPPPPPGFRGAVGSLELSAKLEPDSVAVGQAATLEVTLSGRGHLQGLPDPELPVMEGLQALPPEQETREDARRTEIRGRRSWIYPLVPSAPGTWKIPALQIPFFDPSDGTYKVALSKPLELAAEPAPAGVTTASGGELHRIRSAALPTEAPPGRRWRSFGHWLFLAPWLLGLLLFMMRRRREGAAPVSAAYQRFEQRLGEATEALSDRTAARRVEAAWREFLEARWGLAEGANSRSWGEHLAKRGADREAVEELGRLAADLQYLRHAPQLSSTTALRDQLPERSLELARRLA